MNFLLDTHVFLRLNDAQDKLSAPVTDIFLKGQDRFFISMASAWEIQIKQQIGKLKLDSPLGDMLEINQKKNHLEIIPITLNRVSRQVALPSS